MSVRRRRRPRAMETRTRQLTILAQDPSVLVGGKALTAQIPVPYEELAAGPRGHRVHVVDYDSSRDCFYEQRTRDLDTDPYEGITSIDRLVGDVQFHQQNTYAIVMSCLARFEKALGRRVSWSFFSHQLKVAPHAFGDANAFYTKSTEALLFGYFQGDDGPVFSCLSHDVVAHETTHALVDGLRERYTDHSSADQAAFHEGIADVVALLSVFSLEPIVGAALDLAHPRQQKFVPRAALTHAALRHGVLLGLAEQMGQQMQSVRGDALRQSAKLTPSADYLDDPEFEEPHRRGELLVAAMLNSFLRAWVTQLERLGDIRPGFLDRGKVVEEGASAADRLLTIAIRALDYAPPVNLRFGDFLSALLTADAEVAPDDSKFHYRDTLRQMFAAYGITPTSNTRGAESGVWEAPDEEPAYHGSHFESLQRDPNELMRFLWENRRCLGVETDPFTKVLSVRPTLRIGPDGFALHETVAEYIQILIVRGSDLRSLKLRKPSGMRDEQEIHLYGGGVLIFDEYGRLKFHIRNRLLGSAQQRRLEYLWETGAFAESRPSSLHFAAMHRSRALSGMEHFLETW